MNKHRLVIHTATYNRAHTLPKAYESLKRQKNKDFVWFVTDNGSTDGTEELFDRWQQEENGFEIIYRKIPERGIPRALNYGINHCEGDYFFMLDSDDEITSDAVDVIFDSINEIDNEPDICGAGFVIVFHDGTPVKGVWPKIDDGGYVDCTNLDRYKYDLDADMREVYKIDIIKKYPFAVWKDEIYAPEQICLDGMAMDGYKVRWYKKAIYICEYLEDGQTKGNWDLLRNNKMGYAMLSNQRLLYEKSLKALIRAAAQHIALSINAGYPKYILKSNRKLITFLALPFGLILAIRRKQQFKWDDPVNRRNF